MKREGKQNPIHLAPFMAFLLAQPHTPIHGSFVYSESLPPWRTVKINFKPNGTKKVIFSFYSLFTHSTGLCWTRSLLPPRFPISVFSLLLNADDSDGERGEGTRKRIKGGWGKKQKLPERINKMPTLWMANMEWWRRDLGRSGNAKCVAWTYRWIEDLMKIHSPF